MRLSLRSLDGAASRIASLLSMSALFVHNFSNHVQNRQCQFQLTASHPCNRYPTRTRLIIAITDARSASALAPKALDEFVA